ncbi:2-iminoacetate synthase ThiH [Methanomicrobium sp. W14]|uniref:hypothetical protein n=1 Tax=Methanomicrobium sp. W14 TaxID=2817839 RepID=UPI001AE26AF8|nr:hypothetical protein [Methanomicrobium sp. W14]MBP2133397.1 2-iminoacetate synthase ThiH [Methanomicrobium sp. W14]
MPKPDTLLKDTLAGHELSEEEALSLLKTKGSSVFKIAKAADDLCTEKCGNTVTYVRNQNINVTNHCINSCGFCGFCKKDGEEGTYFYTEDIIREKAKEAHRIGIMTTATIMYGHVESQKDVVSHLKILKDIQSETGGFTEFVPLSFVHYNTPLYKSGVARAGATGREDLLMYAVSRLYLHNFDNIQVSRVKHGTKFAQLALIAGANDIGGTMFEESISKGAGAVNTDYLDPKEMERIVSDAEKTLVQRNTKYEIIQNS